MEKRLKVYVAGPMRGKPYFNFPAFDTASAELREAGFDPVSPAEMDRDVGFDPETFAEDFDWHDLGACEFDLHLAIDRDVAALKKCDAIYLLRGWEKSRGSLAEKAMAEWLDLAVMYQQPVDVLEEALEITQGDRNASYGPPDQDFRRTAAMWSAMFGHMLREDKAFEPEHVAQAMILLKLSRLQHSRKRDSVVDLAGYSRCMDVCYRESGGYES